MPGGAAYAGPVGEGEGSLNVLAWPGYAEDGSTDKAVDWVTPFEQETGCNVNVKVFPSLVAIGRDGKETARIVGSAEKREFMAFLTTATLAEGPAAMLARFERDEPLDAAQWKLLSQIDIQSATAIRPDD